MEKSGWRGRDEEGDLGGGILCSTFWREGGVFSFGGVLIVEGGEGGDTFVSGHCEGVWGLDGEVEYRKGWLWG